MRICLHRNLFRNGFWNEIHTVIHAPETCCQSIADGLEENFSGKISHRSAYRAAHAGLKEARQQLGATIAAMGEILGHVFSVEVQCALAVAMGQLCLIAAEIKKETKRGALGLPGEAGVAQQVVRPAVAKGADALAIFQSQLERAVMHAGPESKAARQASHAGELFSQQGYAAIDAKPIDAVGGHASPDAGLGFENQRGEAAVLATKRGCQAGDATANDDYIRIRNLL